ncbi:DUF4365 domain-containing protein [Phycicoccus sp. MAQZ13P-2]|uniref:DUF4365 domain-containing protein n=1 Tax=Phycicoccus mangrovi TaxID=2840470 RepID=UPI001C00194C|nr:DUF4365 domain-containing protein [Phycicoccus mangrovi]MBT9275956.1 DUF4365 domain-containing protein [Phycicoccus mangrovi]
MENEAIRRPESVERKQSRPSRARGKAGFRRLEAVLEGANIVVQRVEADNDIGRDAFVDIVSGTYVTGGVVCVQVKSGSSFFYKNQWVIPGKPADFTLWRESTVPVFGVVHDPRTDSLLWVDLSNAATMAMHDYLSPVVAGPYGKKAVPVPDSNRLDLEVATFIAAAEEALRRRSGSHIEALLSNDRARVDAGIADTFAIGRHDATAFLLLASLFQRLPKETRPFAVSTLAMATSHPDVFWTRENWIPESVRAALRQRLRWMDSDIVALLSEIDEFGIQRGTLGQTIYHVLELDPDFESKLPRIVLDRTVPDQARYWAAVISLYRAGDEAPEMLERLLSSDEESDRQGVLFTTRRSIEELDGFDFLIQSVVDYGYVSLF